ncbi:MAG: ketoacyl-ACP synthase III [Phycisphaerae bacterium]|nr:ketoacyl-ACP synthase III [Phycisphaerae bacterium]
MSSGTTSGRRPVGVRIAGTGSALPDRRLTNADLEKLMTTSDEWIVQRTGIRERRIIDRSQGGSTSQLAADALKAALADARLQATDLDLIIVATMTAEMSCPASASLVANMVGAGNCGAFDLTAACSGFVYGLNVAHDLIKGGSYRTIGLIGADALSTLMDYSDAGRSTAIIFGDAAGAVILKATDDTSKGLLAQAMHSDGKGWKEIYVPRCAQDFPPGVEADAGKFDHVQMNGASVFKFAVGTFPELIEQTLESAKVAATDVDMYVCHQSNHRILTAARERFGLAEDKLYINIDRYGNTVAASVPLCFDELCRSGRVRDGQKVMFVAFGGGLTWGSSLWQL